MSQQEHEVVLWHPTGWRVSPRVSALARRAQALGGRTALAQWQAWQPDMHVVYVNGEKHDLWWEFTLGASFRWQAHLCGMSPDSLARRLYQLSTGLNLGRLLDRHVEDLTPAELTRANLAVALLPQPDLLVWEEPLYRLGSDTAEAVVDFVRSLVETEGLTVVAVGNRPLRLAELAPRRGKRAAIQ